jgi:archaeosortase B (VPXXXP-CTERM-specific)
MLRVVAAAILDWFRSLLANPSNRLVSRFVLYFGIFVWLRELARPVVGEWVARSTARMVYWVMLPFTSQIVVSGRVVSFDGFPVSIIQECTGVIEAMMFAAAVLATATTWKNRAFGLLVGIPIICTFNVLRIVLLLVAGRHDPYLFDYLHFYFFQGAFILVVTLSWLAWFMWLVLVREKEGVTFRA